MKRRIMGSLMAVLMSTSTILGSCPAPIFAVATTDEKEVVAASATVNANSYGLVSVTEGNILHAWDWKFTDVTKSIEDIANAGYSAVQVSPCQVCENTTYNNDWWQLYQPYDYKFGNSLGDEDAFKEMCATAEKYGVSIIVDVVANHVAGTGTGTCGTRKPEVDSWWTDDKFHNTNVKFTGTYDDNREMMVRSNIGMPDIATEREDVQERMISYLETMLDMGADGFRYDAAKHIGTTGDSGNSKDTFWKNISAAVAKKRPDALVYGEILNSMPVSDQYYVNDGIKVTESQMGWNMKDLVQGSKEVSSITDNGGKCAFDYVRKASADKLITWVENHDTYLNHWGSTGLSGNANYMSDAQIKLAWSTVAARADSQALFFARPDGCSDPKDPSNQDASNTIEGDLGMSTKNFDWKDQKVASVNKFKNAMVGESETTSTESNVAIIKRGNKGVVATNFGSSSATISVSGLSGLKDGTYKDASGQNGDITVSGGSASITVKGNSFVVLYDESAVTVDPTEAPTETPDNGEVAVSASKEDCKFTDAFEVTVTAKNAQEAYYSYDGADWAKFDGTAKVTIGKEELKNGDEVGLYLYAFDKDGKATEKSYTYTKEVKGTAGTGVSVRVKKSDFATAPNIYVYDIIDKKAAEYSAEWPGDKMTAEGDYWVYTNASLSTAMVIINQDDKKWPAGDDETPGFTVSSPSEFSTTTGKMTEILTPPEQGDKKANKPATNPTFTSVATATPTTEPTATPTSVPTDTPAPVVKDLGVEASVADGTSFTAETMDVELTLQNATSGTYSVDDGPEKTFTDKVTVKVGQGKIADRDVTLKVTAINGTETITKTFTYKKVFDKAAAAKEQAVVKVSAVKKLNSIFEVVADAAKVAAASNDTLAAQYGTNTTGLGAKKTINVDGEIGDWDSSMLIAQGAANDDPRCYKAASMHELPVDLYALYGAYDDNNLYLMWEMTNVQDVVAPGEDYPLSQGILYETQELPFHILVDTGKSDTAIGNSGKTQTGATIWDTGLTTTNSFNKWICFNTKGGNGPWVYGGDSTGVNPVELLGPKSTESNISVKFGKGILSKSVIGINDAYGTSYGAHNRVVGDVCDDSAAWADFNTLGHSSATMDFHYEVSIPLEELGITGSDVENTGVGVLVVSTFGLSGMDCLPYDVAMNDNADQDDTKSQPGNSFEKSDEDNVTCSFARIGKGDINPAKTPTPATPTPSADVTSPSPSAEVTTSTTPEVTTSTTPVVTTGTSVTTTPEVTTSTTPEVTTSTTPEVTTSTTPVVSGEAVTSMIVNFGAEKSAPQLTGKTLKLEAEGFNATGKATYEFAVNGTVVQAASEKTTYDWFVGKAGSYTIQVTMADEAGNKVVSTKTYTIEGEDVATPTPVVTATPTAVVATSTAVVTTAPTATPTAIPATPTTEPTTAPTETPVPAKVAVKVKLGKASPQKVGTSIKLTASASGGTSPYKFTYVAALKNGFTKTIAKNTTKKTVTWKPTKAGTYTITVTATDANGTKGSKKFTYKIANKKLAITKLKVSAKKVKVKKKVKITVAGTAKKGTLKFKYSVKLGKKTTVLKKYTTKKTYTWKPKKAGKYTVIVQAKDGSGKVVKKTVKVTVKKK